MLASQHQAPPPPLVAGQVLGFRGGEYKSFSSEAAARQYLDAHGVDCDAQLQAMLRAQRQAEAEADAADAADAAREASGEPRSGSAGGSGSELGSEEEEEEEEVEEEGRAAGSGAPPSTAGLQGPGPTPAASKPFGNSPDAPGTRQRAAAGTKRRSKAAAPPPRPPPLKATAVETQAAAAWEQAAMAWRRKNMPSQAEIFAAKEQAREQAGPPVPRRAPQDHVQGEHGRSSKYGGEPKEPRKRRRPGAAKVIKDAVAGAKASGAAGGTGSKPRCRARTPADKRAQYRNRCQAKVAGASSFVQVRGGGGGRAPLCWPPCAVQGIHPRLACPVLPSLPVALPCPLYPLPCPATHTGAAHLQGSHRPGAAARRLPAGSTHVPPRQQLP